MDYTDAEYRDLQRELYRVFPTVYAFECDVEDFKRYLLGERYLLGDGVVIRGLLDCSLREIPLRMNVRLQHAKHELTVEMVHTEIVSKWRLKLGR